MMIEINEGDFISFCSQTDVMLYNMGIESRISPLYGWDMIIEEVNKE